MTESFKKWKIPSERCNEPEIKVTFIKNRWHGRLILNGKVLNELACERSIDIGYICREMLRWHSKMGHISNRAEFARSRHNGIPFGKIWYGPQLLTEKAERLKKINKK